MQKLIGGQFLSILAVKAVSAAPPEEANAGQNTIAVNPQNTSQYCSNCGEKVPKELSQRTNSCPDCGIVIECDLFAFAQHPVGKHNLGNAAINIKNREAGHPVLKARACPMQWQDCETRSPH
nr:zinc ribbon domain-containing protein [Okeania sp. SIO3B5]